MLRRDRIPIRSLDWRQPRLTKVTWLFCRRLMGTLIGPKKQITVVPDKLSEKCSLLSALLPNNNCTCYGRNLGDDWGADKKGRQDSECRNPRWRLNDNNRSGPSEECSLCKIPSVCCVRGWTIYQQQFYVQWNRLIEFLARIDVLYPAVLSLH